MSAFGEILAKPGSGAGDLLECGKGVAEHGAAVERAGRLVKCPEGLNAISVKLEELTQQPLRDLYWGKIHLIESPK